MIGNDLVDLDDPESRPDGLHPRFDERVFSDAERAALAGASDPVRERWALWACKEGAYKVARKQSPATCFSPRRFEVELNQDGTGRVRHEGRDFALRIEPHARCVHAIVRDAASSAQPYVSGVERVRPGEDAHEVARRLARARIGAVLGLAEEQLLVPYRVRPPLLLLRGARLPVDLSLSHHGGFAAFACEIDVEAARETQ